MKSPLFEPKTREGIERKVRDLLNEQADFLSADTAESTRAAGDAIQSIIEDNFAVILGDLVGEYSSIPPASPAGRWLTSRSRTRSITTASWT
jgi:hypothetical protein